MTKSTYPMACVLITGFAPFDGETINPSWQAVQKLDDHIIMKHRVCAIELSCEFNTSIAQLHQAIEAHNPAIVLCVGQAGGRNEISIERIAINIDDARIKDNAGKQPIDTPIAKNGPDAYFSNLPIKRMLSALHESDIPAAISNTAGTYVCNHVMYGLLHYINENYTKMKGGFIHIPYLPSQAVHHNGAPSMSEEVVINALKVMIAEALSNERDVKIAASTTH
ncbi:pyroglutamyl-peptidase I [Pseudoalteromonas sp. SR45-4]|uniref:pyroglutamyl-peptidase I n=1 Tax=Pseudoalteromonas sp. SR45-4 TaxID=2760929 RepID=UPI001C722754|nr:pyroglutamyl-peptidase I [Pseudoalteromonas sp. SR45-4]